MAVLLRCDNRPIGIVLVSGEWNDRLLYATVQDPAADAETPPLAG